MPPEIMLRRKLMERRLQWIMPIISFIMFFVIWYIGFEYTRFLPSPLAVVSGFSDVALEPETYVHIGATFRRLVIGLIMGIALGTIFALLARFKQRTKTAVDLFVFTALTIPSMAVAFIALMLFGMSETGVYVAVGVITFPFITITLQEGLKSLDEEQLKMAKVYQFNYYTLFRHIIIPHMNPYFFAALRNVHALGWKIVVVAEVFSTSTGVGYKFNHAFDNFSMINLVIWLFFFLFVVLFLEYVILKQVERFVFRWRDPNFVKVKKTKGLNFNKKGGANIAG